MLVLILNLSARFIAANFEARPTRASSGGFFFGMAKSCNERKNKAENNYEGI